MVSAMYGVYIVDI